MSASSPTPQLRTDLLHSLPLPLAQIYLRAFNSASPVSRHHNAYYLTEAWVRLGVAVGIAALHGELASGGAVSPQLAAALAPLRRPSAGQWVGMIRELARAADGKSGHPWAHVFAQLNQQRSDDDIVEFYRRIKNGIDKDPAGDQSCTLLELLDKLPSYRNDVIGHGGQRPETFYVEEMEAILVAAVQQAFGPEHCGILGPSGSKLVIIGEVKTIDDGFVDIQVFELTGPTAVRRSKPLRLAKTLAEKLRPGHVAVEWPGRPEPVSLSPILIGAIDDGAVTIRILNSTTKSKVEYLDFMSGSLSQEASELPALTALLSRIVAGPIPAMPDHPATTEYELLGVLGQGGMGVVHLARQQPLGRLVAVKLLPKELSGDTSFERRLRNEFRALSRCEHPNIIQIYAGGQWHDGSPFYSMEFVPGCDLERIRGELSGSAAVDPDANTWDSAVRSATTKLFGEIAKKNRPKEATAAAPMPLPPIPEALTADRPKDYVRRIAVLFRDAARALHVVHEHNIKHRDIKPANLMLTADGSRIVLMDFGLAQGDDLSRSISGGGFLGTLRYAAPEQLVVTTREFDPATDVRALAVTFWELFTRQRIFSEAKDERQLPEMVVHREVPSLRSIDKRFDRDLDAIMSRATEIRLTDRTKSAKLLADQLDLYLERKELPIRPIGVVERTGRWLRRNAATVAVACCMIALLGVAGYGWFRPRPPASATPGGPDAEKLVRAERERNLSTKAMELMRSHEESLALPYFAAALEQADDPDRRDLDRRRINSILQQSQIPCARWKHDARITATAISSDSRFVATAGLDSKLVRIYETATGKFREPLQLEAGIRAVAFNPDGTRLAVATANKKVTIWDMSTRQRIGESLNHGFPVMCLAFSPDGKVLAAGGGIAGYQKTFTRYVTDNGKRIPVQETRIVNDDRLTKEELSDGYTNFGGLQLWNSASGKPQGSLMRYQRCVVRLLFSPDGTRLVTASSPYVSPPPVPAPAPATALPNAGKSNLAMATPLEFENDNLLEGDSTLAEELPAPDAPPNDSPNKGSDAPVQIWDLRTVPPKWSKPEQGLGSTVQHLSFTGDGFLAMIVGQTSFLYDLDQERLVTKGMVYEKLGKHAAMSPQGFRSARGYLMATTSDKEVSLIHAHRSADGAPPPTPPANGLSPLMDESFGPPPIEMSPKIVRQLPQADASWIEFNNLGTVLATAGKDGIIRFWDTTNGNPSGPSIHTEAPFERMTSSPDGRFLLVVTADQWATLYDRSINRLITKPLPSEKPITPAMEELSRDGRIAVAVDGEGDPSAFLLWNVSTGQMPTSFQDPSRKAIDDILLDADGRSLAVICWPKISLWDVATGTRKSTIEIPAEMRFNPHFSFDRTRVWIAGNLSTAASPNPDAKPSGPEAQRPERAVIKGWNLISGQELAELQKVEGLVNGIVSSPDGQRFAMATGQGKILVWNTETGVRLHSMPIDMQSSVVSVTFSPDHRRLAAANDKNLVRVWNLREETTATRFAEWSVKGQIESIWFSPDSSKVYTSSSVVATDEASDSPQKDYAGELQGWDITTGNRFGRPIKSDARVRRLQFSDDGRFVLVECSTGPSQTQSQEIQVYETATSDPVTLSISNPNWAASCEFARDGRTIRWLTSAGAIREMRIDDASRSIDELNRLAKVLAVQNVEPTGRASPLSREALEDTLARLDISRFRGTENQAADWYTWLLGFSYELGLFEIVGLADDRLLERKPNSFAHVFGRADALSELGRWPEAAAAWAEASKRFANDGNALESYVLCLLKLGQRDEARRVCSEALQRRDRFTNRASVIGAALYFTDLVSDWSPYVAELRQECNRDSSCAPRHVLAWALFHAGKLEESEKTVHEAVERCNHFSIVGGGPHDRLLMALIRARQNQREEAARYFLGALNQVQGDRTNENLGRGGWLQWYHRTTFEFLRPQVDALKLPTATVPMNILRLRTPGL